MTSIIQTLVIRYLSLAFFAVSTLGYPYYVVAQPATAFDIWSELTSFEISTLNNILHKNHLSADETLALYLIAAGDARQPKDFQAAKDKIANFQQQYNQRLQRIKDEEKRGSTLLALMHKHFFDSDEKNEKGYSVDQTKLSTLLKNGEYNCLSSSLLYVVLAKIYDLHTEGVIMTSHAFVQLTTKNGKIIDVETTSPSGFGIPHDEQFYSEENRWFADRSLQVPTYQDYLSRKILSPRLLGAESMWAQHIRKGVMSEQNRTRLVELKSLLQPNDEYTQLNRLANYHNILKSMGQHTQSRKALFTATGRWLDSFNNNAFSNEFNQLWLLMETLRAHIEVQTHDTDTAIGRSRHVLQQIREKAIDDPNIYANIETIVGMAVVDAADKEQFAKGQQLLFDGELDCFRSETCSRAADKFYAEWAEYYWQQSNWSSVITVFNEYFSVTRDNKNSATFTKNAESAYLNWAKQAWLDDLSRETVSRLEDCIAQLTAAKRCERQLREYQKRIKLYH